MFPWLRIQPLSSLRFPRVSGDVSTHSFCGLLCYEFSPRERGCFSSLRLRVCRLLISPRTWGCFSSMHMKDMAPFISPRKWGGLSYCGDFFFLKVFT